MNDLFYFQDNLLNEGGVAGHLSHIYDNYELTFAKMKTIIDKASFGELQGTEKTDGFNIFMSFRNGQARAARNKTDIKKGGMVLGDLLRRPFAGGDDVKKVFVEAFETFEKAVYGLEKEDIEKIFGPNGDIYYNIEIMGPAAENVINYDSFVLSVHRGGYGYFDRESGERVDSVDVSENSEHLNNVIDRMQNAISDNRFNIQRTAIIQLKKLSDNTYADKAKQRIDRELRKYGLNDYNTIQDYLFQNIYTTLKASSNFEQYGEDFLKLAVNSVLGIQSLRDIPKGTPKEVRSFMSQFGRSKKNAREILKKAIWPIEDIIHDFSVQVLAGLESAYILDNQKELERYKSEVEKAIYAIQSYDGPEAEAAQDILQKQLSKIKHIDNINTVVEGFVFEYEGHLYKFTGNYAPVNQLLGLYKWGRGGVPALKPSEDDGELEEAVIGMTAADAMSAVPDTPETPTSGPKGHQPAYAVIPGGYKPPHAGHYQMVREIADLKRTDGSYLVKEVHVLISPKPRDSHFANKDIQITAEDSLAIWKIYAGDDPRIKPQISSNSSPVRATYEFMEHMEPDSIMVVATSEKDKNDKRFAALQSWSDKNGYGINVKTVVVDEFGENVSGTAMRQYIARGDEENFKANLPTHLSPQRQQQIWDIVAPNDVEDIELQEMNRNNIRSQTRKKEKRFIESKFGPRALEEISQSYVDVVDEFMEDAQERRFGRSLSFNDLFKGKNRQIIEMPADFKGEMKEIVDLIKECGYELDLETGNVSREYAYTIPAGPRAGEQINKKEEISLGKFLAKLKNISETLNSSKKETGDLINKSLELLDQNSNKFVDYIIEKYSLFEKYKSDEYDIANHRESFEKTPEQLKNFFSIAINQNFAKQVRSYMQGGRLDERFLGTILWHFGKNETTDPEMRVRSTNPFSYVNAINSTEYAIARFAKSRNTAKIEQGVDPSEIDLYSMFTFDRWTTPEEGKVADIIAQDEIGSFFKQANKFSILDDFIHFFEPLKTNVENIAKVNQKLESTVDVDSPIVKSNILLRENVPQKLENYITFWNQESEKFRTNPEYGRESKYSVVLSRHPIDVLRMSDFRDIQSCHSEGNSYFRCAIAEAHGHGLVAYIVKSSDFARLSEELGEEYGEFHNIDSGFQTDEIFADRDRSVRGITPISRVRARKYVKSPGKEGSYELAMPETRVYGKKIPYFVESVRDWLYESQITKILEKEGYQSEQELKEKKLDTKEFRQHGGSYRDTSPGQVFANFFQDSDYHKLHYGYTVREPAEDEDYGIDALEERLNQWLEDMNFLANRLDNVSVNSDYEVYGDDEYYIYTSLNFVIKEESLIDILIEQEYIQDEEEVEFAFPDSAGTLGYRARRAFEDKIYEILDNYYIYGEINYDTYGARNGNHYFSVRPEDVHTEDEAINFVESVESDFDDEWDSFLEEVVEMCLEEEYILLPDKEPLSRDSHPLDKFLAKLPLKNFDVKSAKREVSVSAEIPLGKILNMAPLDSQVAQPLAAGQEVVEKFYKGFINYLFNNFRQNLQPKADKQQVMMNLNEETERIESVVGTTFSLASNWKNMIDKGGTKTRGLDFRQGGGAYGLASNIIPSDEQFNKNCEVRLTDDKKLKVIKAPALTMPLVGKLEYIFGKSEFSTHPQEMRDFLKFLIWIDEQNFRDLKILSNKYLQYLNAVSLQDFAAFIPKIVKHVEENLDFYFEGGLIKRDNKWVENALVMRHMFSNLTDPAIKQSINISNEEGRALRKFMLHDLYKNNMYDQEKFINQFLPKDSKLEEYNDSIPGGKADTYSPKDFDRNQLKIGTRVEFEHTNDIQKAIEIAMDHLVEDPEYYQKLKKVHVDENMSQYQRSYYEIDNHEPQTTVEVVHKKWINGQKLVDGVYYFPLDQLYDYREYDWSAADFRGMHQDPKYYFKLEKSMVENGWKENEPLIIQLGKNGCGKVAEGNHRLSIAIKHKKRFNKIPVRFLFQDEVFSDDGEVKCVEKIQELSSAGGGAVMGAPNDKWLEKKEYEF